MTLPPLTLEPLTVSQGPPGPAGPAGSSATGLMPNGTNDTPALQALVDDGQKYIRLGEGLFHLATVFADDDVTIEADPSATTILNISLIHQPLFYASGKANVRFIGLNIDGANILANGKAMVHLYNCDNCLIQGCLFKNVHNIANSVQINASRYCKAYYNRCVNVGYGFVVGTMGADTIPADYNEVCFNYVENAYANGIFHAAALETVPTSTRMTGNTIIGNTIVHAGDCGIESSRNCDECVIADNEVTDSFNCNILVRGGDYNVVRNNRCTHSRQAHGAGTIGSIFIGGDFGAITSCVVEGNQSLDNASDGIIVQAGVQSGIVLKDNVCLRNAYYGIYIWGGGVTRCRVEGNVCSDNVAAGILQTHGSASVINTQHLIAGNTCQNNGSQGGIYVTGDYNMVLDNVCVDTKATPTQPYGITLANDAYNNHNQVRGNICLGNTTYDIRTVYELGTGHLIQDNLVGTTNCDADHTDVPGTPGPTGPRGPAGFTMRGSVANYAALPADPATGDAYVTDDTGHIWIFTAHTYPPEVLEDIPVGYWRFEETSGVTAADSSGSDLTLDLIATPTLGATGALLEGEEGDYAIELNGTTEYAHRLYDAALNPAAPFSIECWAYPTGGAGTFRVPFMSRGITYSPTLYYGSFFRASDTNVWQFWLGQGTSTWATITGPAVTLNTWVHLVGVYDGTKAWFYVNGTLQNVGGTTSAFSANTSGHLWVGTGPATGLTEAVPESFFPGRVDEVAVYATALSAARVTAHYEAATIAGEWVDGGQFNVSSTDLTAIDARVDTLEATDITYDGRLDTLEATDTALDTRVDTLEAAVPELVVAMAIAL